MLPIFKVFIIEKKSMEAEGSQSFIPLEELSLASLDGLLKGLSSPYLTLQTPKHHCHESQGEFSWFRERTVECQ